MRTFKKMRSINLSYAAQGYIFFLCKTLQEQPEEIQRKVLNLCVEIGGADYAALYEVLTSGKSVRAVSIKSFVPERRLYSLRKNFYESWRKK